MVIIFYLSIALNDMYTYDHHTFTYFLHYVIYILELLQAIKAGCKSIKIVNSFSAGWISCSLVYVCCRIIYDPEKVNCTYYMW